MNMLVRAELTKITRQRGLLVCGFLLIPALTMMATLLLNAIPLANGQAVASVPVLRTTTRSLMVAGNPIAQLLYALGAAGIFAVDYRYSGWRQVVPRAGRTRPLAAKVICFAVLAGISLILVMVGDVLALMVTTLARGQFAPTTDWTSTGFMRLCGSFVISLVELLALGAVAAISATLTRSLMAATMVPFLLGLAASSVKAYTTTDLANMPLPTFAADTLRAGLSGGWASSLIWNAAVLAGWCAIGFGSALLVLRRQDLVAE